MAVTSSEARRKRLLPGAIEAGLRRLGRVAMGGGLVSVAVMGWVSLATWSIHDPSLNHATHETPRNLLGYLGAAAADLTFQSLGLAAAALFLPFAAGGWHLIAGSQSADKLRLRMLAWPVSALLIAAGLAAFAAPERWPLPNGLGGIMGDLVLAVLQFIGAMLPSVVVAIIGGAGFLVAGLICLLFACGIPLTALALLLRFERREGSSALVAMTLGALTHCVLSARAVTWRLLRLRPRRAPGSDVEDMDEDGVALGGAQPNFPNQQPGRRAVDPTGRIEPVFGDQESFGHTDAAPQNPSPEGGFGYTITRTEKSETESTRRVVTSNAPTQMPTEYSLPPLRLMKAPRKAKRSAGIADDILQENARLLEVVLQDFGVKGDIINVRPGPVVTLYELEPAPGTKSSRVIGLADDIARSMSAVAARVAVIPGRNAIGIELPNMQREMVYFRELLETDSYQRSEAGLALALGKTIGGEPVIADLSRMPHLLIAGTTGSGKSVGINTMILSLLYRLTPEQCRFIMVDPKMLELSVYEGIPHLLAPVVTDPKKAVVALKWTVREMEERYRKMSKVGVRNIHGYNARVLEAQTKGETIVRTVQTGFDRETGQAIYEQEEMDYEPFPYIVVIVDEMADLMMVAGKDIEGAVQ
ncbi:MAG: DNA translocase FtsK 4TM domain-containing protein, partial [Methyloligellaceae bacterium]